MKEKTWKPWPDGDCPDCGCGLEVLTECTEGGWTMDCDPLRCEDPACPRHTQDLGHTVVMDEDAVSQEFEGWPIGEDDQPYNPAQHDSTVPEGAR